MNIVQSTTAAFVIHYCIVTHIKITIQSLYCNPLPYCDHNTDSPFLLYHFFKALPYGHIDIAKADIDIYKYYSYILDIYLMDKKYFQTGKPILVLFYLVLLKLNSVKSMLLTRPIHTCASTYYIRF